MSERIPIYQLQAFASGTETGPEVYFPDYGTVKPSIPLHQPYRGDYYKISLCVRGSAELNINLEAHRVTPGCLVLATPDVIKQWGRISEDYETLSVFFTKNFITDNNTAAGKLRFFVAPAPYVLPLAPAEAAGLAASFRFLGQKYHTPNVQRENIIKNIINCLLYEIGALYERQPAAGISRGRVLAAAFQQLVQQHSASARSVKFYAEQLCITPKYLNELVKKITGQTASDWISAAVVLEAKALLQNPDLPVQQIAASLQFTDQFAFSRFFKTSTGLSPTAYRQAG